MPLNLDPPFATHQVHNTGTAFADINLYSSDLSLQQALQAQLQALPQFQDHSTLIQQRLHALGADLARSEWQELARQANQSSPRLQQFDRVGNRVDEVEFHPAWHQLMQNLIAHGAHAAPWREDEQSCSQLERAARYILFGQVENGSQCPTTMTYAVVPALRHAPQIAQVWLPKILSLEYDPRSLPIAQKRGALMGMGMTEKQGGTDVRANTTFATATGERDAWGERYRVVGHKWFFSAPQCDAHLILAQTEEGTSHGLSCFFLPRYLPDGSRNAICVQRLKEKMGNRSNASSEVEFCGAIAYPVGAIGRGVATIMEMGSLTRLDCVLGTAGIMRAALCHALQHCRTRRVFGKYLSEQPLMQNVLADLSLESEAATMFALRLARCFDVNTDDEAGKNEAALARLLTAAGKYWLCKRGTGFGAEAMEVLGGNGYVEDGPLSRLYREFPVNSIWEGSGNVMCLDLLRVLGKGPGPQQALAQELGLARGQNADFDRYAAALLAKLDAGGADEGGARTLAMEIVLAVQAALLLRHAPPAVAQGFIASRIAQPPSACYGNLPAGVDVEAILQRALPPGMEGTA